MPTYQYACTACDHRFDAVQSFSDASLTECPVCSGPLRKVFSSVGIVFKGSGFYRTDSRSGSGNGEAKVEPAAAAAKADSSSDASGTAKKKDTAKDGSGSTSKPSTPSGSSSSSTPSAAAS